MKTTTTTVRTKKYVLPPNTFAMGGYIYPISQLEDVFAAEARGLPFPKPLQQYSCSYEEYLFGR